MYCEKELKLTHSKLKFQWWAIGAIFGIVFTFSGCENNSDEYYVKYEVLSNSPGGQYTINATINSDSNVDLNFSFGSNFPWETIIGPVQKGFNATLKVSCEYDHMILNTAIYVSKNDSPFALKQSDGSDEERDYVEISYTIDY